MDAGSVGTLTLAGLESDLQATECGRLARPGTFIDFTRYRPTMHFREGLRELSIPNCTLSYAQGKGSNDFLFLNLLEPHMFAEDFVDSVLQVLERFGVKRYCLIGSMYDVIPYTRPFPVTGSGNSVRLQNDFGAAGIRSSDYTGPTTIALLIPQKAAEKGIETASMIVHLPNYLTPENDYRGKARLMEALGSMYGFVLSKADIDKAREQADSVNQVAEQMLKDEPRYRILLQQLEENYDAKLGQVSQSKTRLSPELERLLQDLGKGFGTG